jgi:hypothetical protein
MLQLQTIVCVHGEPPVVRSLRIPTISLKPTPNATITMVDHAAGGRHRGVRNQPHTAF